MRESSRLCISRSLLDSGKWPNDMKYITCDDYDGKNTPNRTLDLKTAFQEVRSVAQIRNSHGLLFLPQNFTSVVEFEDIFKYGCE